MKRLIFAASFLLVMASCDITIIEPRYDSRDKFVGYYAVEEYSETYNDYTHYSISISKDYNSSYIIYLHNFYGADISVYAQVDYNKITIPYQVVDGYEIEGVGTLSGADINLNYRVKDLYNNSRTDFCEVWADR